jgi:Protein of unknown function (DUF3376)
LKLTAVRALVAQLITGLLDLPARSPVTRTIAAIVDAWAQQTGAIYQSNGGATLVRERVGDAGSIPRWVRFLLAFDIDFRKRRLYFLIQGQNRLYQMLDDTADDRTAVAVDRLKRAFYHCLDSLRRTELPTFFSDAAREEAWALFGDLPATESWREPEPAQRFVREHGVAIDGLIDRMASEIDLDASTHELDALLAATDPAEWAPVVRREVLVNYLGFPFWDVLTLSVTNWRDIGEFDEILVDRISPRDARFVAAIGATHRPKGAGMAHFAAFFSRAYREHDYLLGRLHGIDRLIDIVCNAAGIAPDGGVVDVAALKRRAFAIVLDAEEQALPASAGMIGELRAALGVTGG